MTIQALLLLTAFSPFANGFVSQGKRQSLMALDMSKVGVFYGTSTGNTEEVAEMIFDELENNNVDVEGPFDVDSDENVIEMFNKCDVLVVGAPTWNTGADTERSGTGWDELFYSSIPEQKQNLKNKKVAVFGLGDQLSYGENYADATGELHDVFENCGCNMLGYTSQKGYQHEASKAIRGEQFCGLLCDMINQDDMTEDRITNWIAQLKGEGMLDSGSEATSVAPPLPVAESVSTSTDASSKIGVFYGTSTGNTGEVADMIVEELENNNVDVEGPFDVEDDGVIDMFKKYDALVIGAPTWNTGADTERSGTGWDELLYSSIPEQQQSLKDKKVAVFGLGDQMSYGENYADATGELHDVFENCGCNMLGYTSQRGYQHEASKAIRGDQFCGLMCDMMNQEDLTEDRIKNWFVQLKTEGILNRGTIASTGIISEAPTPSRIENTATPLPDDGNILSSAGNAFDEKVLEDNSKLLDQNIAMASHDNPLGFIPHTNHKTGKTMWISADGHTSYAVMEKKETARITLTP